MAILMHNYYDREEIMTDYFSRKKRERYDELLMLIMKTGFAVLLTSLCLFGSVALARGAWDIVTSGRWGY